MQRRRFYAPPPALSASAAQGDRIALSADESHHLLRVLRLARGDEVYVFDGCGNEFRAVFISVDGKCAAVEIIERLTDVVESPLPLTLAVALMKGEKFDFVVQKATELGVRRVVPLITEHADVKVKGEQTGRRLERWQRISLEALKQSGRRRLVEISEPTKPRELLIANAAGTPAANLYFNERGGASLTEALVGAGEENAVTVFVGPEGGWGEQEFGLFERHGCVAVSLGRRILRAETAAIVAVSLVQHMLGDLSR